MGRARGQVIGWGLCREAGIALARYSGPTAFSFSRTATTRENRTVHSKGHWVAEDVLVLGPRQFSLLRVEVIRARRAGVSCFMARVLGKAGRYVSEQATKRLHKMWVLGLTGM